LNNITASEGAPQLLPGVTIFGTGVQTSVSSGLAFCCAITVKENTEIGRSKNFLFMISISNGDEFILRI
jgi:hypothetical protein